MFGETGSREAPIGGATTNSTKEASAAMTARYPRMSESGSARNTPGKLEKRDPEIHYSMKEAERLGYFHRDAAERRVREGGT
jgi:hypothetical protein